MNTSQKILEYIAQNPQTSPKDLYNLLNIGPRAVFKQLKVLCEKGLIQKLGRPPKVFYTLTDPKEQPQIFLLDEQTRDVIEKNFYYVSPLGQQETGVNGFRAWCAKQNLDAAKTAKEYALTMAQYGQYQKEGLIDGMPKMRSTFKEIALDRLFYLDFYAIERFGKTRLGQLVLLAKSSQNKKQIAALVEIIDHPIKTIISQFDIDAAGFIPPTVKREVQLINELKKRLHIRQRLLSIVKAKTDVLIAQKTLNKLQDRIDNAKQTLIVEDKTPFNNILLIDDAVGSGATLNETAAQIKRKNLCRGQIVGLAIVGSFKGFDVISEV
ncbi:MAG: winged helix-turn-helix transcriptional regulator [Candidatus Omnitrophica bacterium]|nr:winged helix-turn-helix transcriptional regulator [Candidatus Omnitrophota bacterium]